MTHTPTPWTWDKRGESLNGSDGRRVIVYACGLSLSGLPDETSIANSRLIVTAVNAFEPMREALQAALEEAAGAEEDMRPFGKNVRAKIADALALADKEQP